LDFKKSDELSKDSELERLRAENRQLKMERDILKKSHCLLREGKRLRFEFVAQNSHRWKVSTMCR
jgi:transposase-like protein